MKDSQSILILLMDLSSCFDQSDRDICVACVYRYNDFDADPTGFDSAGNSVYRIRLGIRMEF